MELVAAARGEHFPFLCPFRKSRPSKDHYFPGQEATANVQEGEGEDLSLSNNFTCSGGKIFDSRQNRQDTARERNEASGLFTMVLTRLGGQFFTKVGN